MTLTDAAEPSPPVAAAEPQILPYRQFALTVRRVQRLSPSFVRVTFTGPDAELVGWQGADQRIKLVLPLDGQDTPVLPDGPDWYQQYRMLDPAVQPPIRTYTVRDVRPQAAEVDVDLVLHGDIGPASRWAGRAAVGDRVLVIAPDARWDGPTGGFEWQPPVDVERVLVVADETAVPAAAVIVSRLAQDARGDVVLSVPTAQDVLALDCPAGVRVHWLARDAGGAAGAELVDAVRALDLGRRRAATAAVADDGEELLWEAAEAAVAEGGLYAWVAGEASQVRAVRRHLVQELGVDRRAVSFMGYWRRGHAEA